MDNHSPLKKAANSFSMRAKKMKGGSELDFKAREKSWLESYDIDVGDMVIKDDAIVNKDDATVIKDDVRGIKDDVKGIKYDVGVIKEYDVVVKDANMLIKEDNMVIEKGNMLIKDNAKMMEEVGIVIKDGNQEIEEDEKVIRKKVEESDMDIGESDKQESRIQILKEKIVLAQKMSLQYKVKHKKIIMMKEAKLKSNHNLKVRLVFIYIFSQCIFTYALILSYSLSIRFPQVEVDIMKNKLCDLKKLQSKSMKSAKKSGTNHISDVDSLLKLPNTVGKTSDETLDDWDKVILKRDLKYKEDSAKLDLEIEIGKKKKEDYRKRLKENALLRNRLAQEISKNKLKQMFGNNLVYLKSIHEGETYSARHEDFHKSENARQALLYTMITDPFTDEQVDWVLKEIKDVWMKNSKDMKMMGDYIWKVILPECLIKLYSDFFEMSRTEAEKRIKETPVEGESEEDFDTD